MVLYDVVSEYHLLRAIVANKKNNKESVLLIYDEKYKKLSPNVKNYLNNNFNKIITYDISFANNRNDTDVKKYFSSLLGKISDYEKIYSSGVHLALAIILLLQILILYFAKMEQVCFQDLISL